MLRSPRPLVLLALGALVGAVGSVMGTALASRGSPAEPASRELPDDRQRLQDEVERTVLLEPVSPDRRYLLLSWLAEIGDAPLSEWASGHLPAAAEEASAPAEPPE